MRRSGRFQRATALQRYLCLRIDCVCPKRASDAWCSRAPGSRWLSMEKARALYGPSNPWMLQAEDTLRGRHDGAHRRSRSRGAGSCDDLIVRALRSGGWRQSGDVHSACPGSLHAALRVAGRCFQKQHTHAVPFAVHFSPIGLCTRTQAFNSQPCGVDEQLAITVQ